MINPKYSDRFKKVTIYKISDDDLDRLIKEVYGFDYRFCVSEEACNDSCKEFSVDKGMSYDDLQRIDSLEKDVKDSKKFGEDIPAYLFFNDLAYRGLIDEGDYLVEVCW